MSKARTASANPFNPKVVLALVLFGALAFLATLYFIGTGNTGGDTNDGSAHGAGKGLTGYAALAGMLEAQGHDVTLSRSQGSLDTDGLLVLTPPVTADPEEVTKAIQDRRYIGPTLVILPKWLAFQAQGGGFGSDVKDGWVRLYESITPDWAEELDFPLKPELGPENSGWVGLGQTGTLPDPEQVMGAPAGEMTAIVPLVRTRDGLTLAGYAVDDGYYPVLADAAGVNAGDSDYLETDKWGVIFVIEPDLMNNYGFADRARGDLAYSLVTLAMEGEDLPVTFDLTFNGFGSSKNLLTLAFTAPFLAATLCLILALFVVGWRAFRRFGPPMAEGRSIAFGKARLIKNSAGFIQRSKRLHLLSGPYADMTRDRVTKLLALRKPDDETLDAAVSKRAPDAPQFSSSVEALRAAKSPNEILRTAAALKAIERMLSK
ncbi:DUF4350 domain-containing protein [Pontixanthobacter aestiaquae]|uniref:DUF4350 domain-containing protein n=1 Tax=Pontixanthobacter aestiaquae TaxID=1509367 RepID=A0A844Z5J6_9SPHN|nr:DUF4350 domain-containing protein [Pontixanthobacter aestiaquae]MDN3646476.1 DUF4350 domain-containing protein [Pontixanthobacter aestiaquae]MXO82536.1 DUF4350 domain-containing protein [Pontixanthobacter aestiaquae]